MNNRGFTLIELIMVVAILALLVMIFTPNVMSLINKNNMNTYNDTIKSIENAAKVYVSDNRYSLGVVCPDNNETSVTIQTLLDTGDLTRMPENKCDKQVDFNINDSVQITYNCTTKQYSYHFRDLLENASDCS